MKGGSNTCGKSTGSKRKYTSCVKLAALALLAGPTLCGCASKSFAPALNIYQPPVLTLEAGTEVRTVDGVYKAQTRETWHSDARYCELESKYIKLLGK